MTYDLPIRLMRLRQSKASRHLLQETRIDKSNLIMPLFISEVLSERKPIHSMPGLFQLSLNELPYEIEEISTLGLPAVILFGIPAHKDAIGSSSFSEQGIVQQAIRRIRDINPDLLIISDICFCEYTDHGHCGVLSNQRIDIDKTLDLLAKQALSHAAAGADWLAPSGSIDGMVLAIRQALEKNNFSNKAILSYTVKYASPLSGPFREAEEGAPKFGDRKSYQMNPANSNEALREAELDLQEGADLLMVKPALYYLDVIQRLKQQFPQVPIGAYQVSGEYAMIKAAASFGMQEKAVLMESILSIKRAGADFIISYFAKDIARILAET